jgi:hypothetical protein
VSEFAFRSWNAEQCGGPLAYFGSRLLATAKVEMDTSITKNRTRIVAIHVALCSGLLSLQGTALNWNFRFQLSFREIVYRFDLSDQAYVRVTKLDDF